MHEVLHTMSTRGKSGKELSVIAGISYFLLHIYELRYGSGVKFRYPRNGLIVTIHSIKLLKEGICSHYPNQR